MPPTPDPNTGQDAASTEFAAWTGRSETVHETLAPWPLQAYSAILDRTDPAPDQGTPLPPLAHWGCFLSPVRQSELALDGHRSRGVFLPPVPLPRRMWAGGRLDWQPDNPLRVGDAAQRVSRVASVVRKQGRSGELVFVLVRHEMHNAAGLALVEEQDLVYREAARPGDAPPQPVAAQTSARWREQVIPAPVLLFRYSAMTFNGHRIHYDRDYAVKEERYPGLVVHGPLIATLLADLARRNVPAAQRIAHFEFRAVRPLFDLHPFWILGEPEADGRTIRLWAHDHEGWEAMRAQARFT